MTQEQYQRAKQISERLDELSVVKKELENAHQYRLTYEYYSIDTYSSSKWISCPSWKMDNIREILEKHDVMIRQEIEEEVKKLKSEIEAL